MNFISLKERMTGRWVIFSLFWLLMVALLGVLMRYMQVWPVQGVAFGNILHAHSHLAFLGWLYSAIFALLVFHYIPEEKLKFYNDLFWFSQITVAAMVVAFSVQSYGLFSITFSSLHMLLAYLFTFKFIKDTRHQKKDISLLFSKAALILMCISTLGPWTLGIAGALKSGSNELMKLLINFYLHFQINGWFLFAITGLFLSHLKKNSININEHNLKKFFALMVISVLPAYALSALWIVQNNLMIGIAGLAALMQIYALVILFKELIKNRYGISSKLNLFQYVLVIILVTFLLKNILQVVTVIPVVTVIFSKIRLAVIGYLHLFLLGTATLSVVYLFLMNNYLRNNKLFKLSLFVFVSGFVLSEILIFLQVYYYMNGWGYISNYDKMLFYISLLLPAGVCGIFFNNLKWSALNSEKKTIVVFKDHPVQQ